MSTANTYTTFAAAVQTAADEITLCAADYDEEDTSNDICYFLEQLLKAALAANYDIVSIAQSVVEDNA